MSNSVSVEVDDFQNFPQSAQSFSNLPLIGHGGFFSWWIVMTRLGFYRLKSGKVSNWDIAKIFFWTVGIFGDFFTTWYALNYVAGTTEGNPVANFGFNIIGVLPTLTILSLLVIWMPFASISKHFKDYRDVATTHVILWFIVGVKLFCVVNNFSVIVFSENFLKLW